jgi:dihydroxyacetone kinase-like predicted kinase
VAPHNDPRDAGLTGELIAAWARRSAELLHHHRSEINGLNVFPIPDADTGSNMTATMESAVAALDAMQLPTPQDAATVAAALAAGAVRGARGNSGMVLSQILRALAETASMSPTGELNATAVPTMLTRAERLVCTAMSDPVEGTVITVLRRAAAGAAAVGPDAPLAVVADAARTAAQEALAATTDQLDALREAGVVDAGGRGLVVILDALHDALAGTAAGTTATGPGTAGTGGAPEQCAVTGAGAALEIMFTFRGPADRLRTVLENSGDSVIVVGDGGGAHRAHVHTRSAGPLIEEIFALGEVGDLRLEVLPESGVTDHDRGRTRRTSPVYALAPAGGPREIFARAGATVGDPAEVLPDDRVSIVLTNGQETGALPASLAAGLTVVDTGSLVGGLAALAVSAQRSAVVPGSAADSTAAAVVATAGDLLADGGELVTVLYDPALPEVAGATLQESLAASWPGVEVHTIPVPGLGMVAQVGVE